MISIPTTKAYDSAVSEWRNVVTYGLIFAAWMELIEIGKWVFTDGWSGVFRFHLRLNRVFLAHCVGLVYSAAIFGIVITFGWRAFQGAPLTVLVILSAPVLIAFPFRRSIRNYFRDDAANFPAKAHQLPFPQ
jgi:hypothetical protein